MTVADSVKGPEVAGMFYPDNARGVADLVDSYLARAAPPALAAKALIAPHAGYPFSGPTAGVAYAALGERARQIERVVIASPPHRFPVRGIALHPASSWESPLGQLAVDQAGWDAIAEQACTQVEPAAFAGEHGIEVHLPFIQRALGAQVRIVPLLVGLSEPAEIAAAFEAVWGGAETLLVVSSDLSHFYDRETAEGLDSQTSAAIERLDGAALGEQSACGRHSIRGLLAAGASRFMRATTLARANSSDAGAPPDKVVGYGAYVLEDGAEARLDPASRQRLLESVPAAVRDAAATGRIPQADLTDAPAPLAAHRASFVTLYSGGRLRACIGSVNADTPLLADAVANAGAAALRDPRVPPVTPEEAEAIAVSVAILSPFVPAPAASRESLKAALAPGIDGVSLQAGENRGLFLPQVWAGVGHDPDTFLARLVEKAGLAPGSWPADLQAWRFRVEALAGDGAPAG